jgi:hypothetical protein
MKNKVGMVDLYGLYYHINTERVEMALRVKTDEYGVNLIESY